jgi:hypothetical protein
VSQSDSVQSVEFARELLSPLYGAQTATFNEQVLNSEVAARASLESKQAVESVTGEATVGRAKGTIVEAHSADVIHRDDAVRTGSDAVDGASLDVSAASRLSSDGPGLGTKRIQLALSDVRVDDEAIRPFGVYDLLEGSRVIDTIDNPDAVVEVRRTPTGQISVTRSSADPAAQAQHYNETRQIQDLGAQYGINPNGRGSGTSPGPFLQPINFTIDLPDALKPPSIDPIGARINPVLPRVPDDPIIPIIPLVEPPVVRAALTPVILAGPNFADTVTFDEFSAVTGTVSANNPNPGTPLTFGISGGSGSGTSTASISGPVALSAVNPTGETYDVSARGTYGTLYLNSATGAYIFVPDDAAINALTEDATETFVFTVSDGTTTVSQPFTIALNGENDEPLLSPVTGSAYADTATSDDFDAVTGTLQATDVDAGAVLTYGIAGGASGGPVVLNGVSYDVSQRGTYGTLHINSATGAYVFVPDDAAINGLTADTTENFTFTVSDGTLTDSQAFKITLAGQNDKPVLSPVTGPTYTDTRGCDDFAAAAGTLQATDVDAGTTLTYGIAGGTSCHPVVLHGVTYDVSQRGDYGTLYVNSATGDYTFVPNDKAINRLSCDTSETFTFTVSDGALTDSQSFEVTLDGKNDKPELSPVCGPTYTDTPGCDDFAPAAGRLQARDADAGTTLTYGITGGTSCDPIVLDCVSYDVSRRGDYGTLYVNSETGAYVFVPNDKAINDLCDDTTETFTLTVSDGELCDSQPFTVTLNNENLDYHDRHHKNHHDHDKHYDHDGDASILTASSEAAPDDAETASVAQVSQPDTTAEPRSVAPSAGETTDSATVTSTQTISSESSWIVSFASQDDGGDHFDLEDDAGGADPTDASPAALVVSTEGLHSFIFHSPPATAVDSQTQPTAGLDSGQPSVEDANNNDPPADPALDMALSTLQLQLRAEPDHFILQA